MLFVVLIPAVVGLLVLNIVLNYAAYRGRISYGTFFKVVGLALLGTLWFFGILHWWLLGDGIFVVNALLVPFLIWLLVVGALIGGLSASSGGSVKSWCLWMDDKARVRATERKAKRGIPNGGDF